MPKLNCKALNCDTELDGAKKDYCSNRCKQTVKYAIKTGRQCKACGKVIKVPVAVLGGFQKHCDRKLCTKARLKKIKELS